MLLQPESQLLLPCFSLQQCSSGSKLCHNWLELRGKVDVSRMLVGDAVNLTSTHRSKGTMLLHTHTLSRNKAFLGWFSCQISPSHVLQTTWKDYLPPPLPPVNEDRIRTSSTVGTRPAMVTVPTNRLSLVCHSRTWHRFKLKAQSWQQRWQHFLWQYVTLRGGGGGSRQRGCGW